MAIDYAKVLQAQKMTFDVIGRGAASAAAFKEKTGVSVHQGGLQAWLDQENQIPGAVIVAVGVEQLAEITVILLKHGVKRILVEKPAGLDLDEINRVAKEAEKQGAEVYVAYNRRFYASVIKAREIIASDGGVTSFTFEFTEWSHVIAPLDKDPRIKEQWFLANSTHVTDLAFYLGGIPEKISCYTAGSLPWHPLASIFSGAGLTESGAIFSYHANWESPGRWGVEVLTRKHRLILRPLEKLQVQKIGSIHTEEMQIDDPFDQEFKPGLYLQVEAFITGKNSSELLSIVTQAVLATKFYAKMANYSPLA